MKRFLILLCIAALLLAGAVLPAGVFADGAHPITLTAVCDPVPELEGDGTIPSLLFTIRNESDRDYTLSNAKLVGGFENREMILDGEIVVLAGATKEFTLSDVPVREDQLDTDVVYTLMWNERETVIDPDTGDATFLMHQRDASAVVHLERFVIPVLTVSAACEDVSVRSGNEFTVEYTVRNDTEFDISGLKLYDPEQSMQTIPLPASELNAGQSFSVKVNYTMGSADMTFDPYVEYVGRRREMKVTADTPITVECVLVDLSVTTEMRPVTAEGTTFLITVKNNGNRTIRDICVYDEINTLIEGHFQLEPDMMRTVLYTVQPAVSMNRIRSVSFHVTALDYLDEPIEIDDPQVYSVVPYVSPDDVRISLSVLLQAPYYDEEGKLCASVQFHIRNSGDVKIYNAVLNELTLFGTVTSYPELRSGDTYYTQIYQLDGVNELRFRLDAVDPSGTPCYTDTVRLDLTNLRELADRKNDPIYVQTTNPYMQNIDARYGGILRIIAIIAACVAGICGIICILLYIVERRIKAKLPGEFEDDMERALRSSKRRTEPQLFSDMPTEQFGYVAPIKLRNYGELTEEEAKQRREQYAQGLRENLRKEGAAQHRAKPAIPVRTDKDGTQVLPVQHPERAADQLEPNPVRSSEAEPVKIRQKPQAPVEQEEPVKIWQKPQTPVEQEEPVKIYQRPERTRPVEADPAPRNEAPSNPDRVTKQPQTPVRSDTPKAPVVSEPDAFVPIPQTVVFPTVRHVAPSVEKPSWFAAQPDRSKEPEPEPTQNTTAEPAPEPTGSHRTGPRRLADTHVSARRPLVPVSIRRMDG